MTLYSHLHKKFPDHRSLIEGLLQENEIFAEICADYEEICTWLYGRTDKKTISKKEYIITRDLILDLEDEILTELRKAGK